MLTDMKKLVSILMCALLICACFTGCKSANAELTEDNVKKTVEIAMEALRDFDTKKMGKYIESESLSTILTFAKGKKQVGELGKKIFENLTYEVKSVDLENMNVVVTVRNKDMYNEATDFANSLKSSYNSFELLAAFSNDEFLNTKLDVLTKTIDGCELYANSYDIDLTIIQKSKNLALGFNQTAEDIVSGGVLSAINSIFGEAGNVLGGNKEQ